jgi:Fe-S cluster assembly ATPase SufC
MSEKKKDKRLAHATAKWEKEQLQAAVAAEQIDKALAVIMQYKDELTELQLKDVLEQTRKKKEDIEAFLLKARDKYAKKLDELNLEAVIHTDEKPSLVNLEDL